MHFFLKHVQHIIILCVGSIPLVEKTPTDNKNSEGQ